MQYELPIYVILKNQDLVLVLFLSVILYLSDIIYTKSRGNFDGISRTKVSSAVSEIYISDLFFILSGGTDGFL